MDLWILQPDVCPKSYTPTLSPCVNALEIEQLVQEFIVHLSTVRNG